MAQYRLDIHSPAPWAWWPTLNEFHGAKRQRRDAAFLLMRRAIYEAMDGESLRDRPIAHELMQKATAAEQNAKLTPGTFVSATCGGWGFHLYRVR